MEILKSHFTQEEIQAIQELPDFAETKLKVEQMQADKMLDTLATRIWENIKNAKTLKENKEALEKKEIELLSVWEKKLKASFKETKLGKLLPDSIVDWIANKTKDVAWEKINGFKGTVIWFILGLIPGVWLLMKGYKNLTWGDGDSEETNEDTSDDSPEEGSKPDSVPVEEWVAEWNETVDTLRNKTLYANIGKWFMRQISWEVFTQWNESDSIFSDLANISLWDLQSKYTLYIQELNSWVEEEKAFSNLTSSLWINKSWIADKQTIISVLESTVWVISMEISWYYLTTQRINILAKDTQVKAKFWEDFCQSIAWKTRSELSLSEVQICLALSIPPVMREWISSMGTEWLIESMFSWDSLKASSEWSPIISQEVIEIILWGSGGSSTLQNDPEFKRTIAFDSIENGQTREQINLLIWFKNTFLSQIAWNNRYNLWMDNFSDVFNSDLDYKKVTEIYVALNGNANLSTLNDVESSMVYLWILRSFENKWAYVWRLAHKISEEDFFTDVQKSLIAKHAWKVSDSFVSKSLALIDTSRDGLKEFTKIEIAQWLWIQEEDIPDGVLDWVEILLIWGFVVWGFAVYKLPMPLHFKIILWWAMHTVWFSTLASILYDRGTFKTIFDEMWETPLAEKVDQMLLQKYKMSLEDVANSSEKPSF